MSILTLTRGVQGLTTAEVIRLPFLLATLDSVRNVVNRLSLRRRWSIVMRHRLLHAIDSEPSCPG